VDDRVGLDCSVEVVTLTDDVAVRGRVVQGQWKYYRATHQPTMHDTVQFVLQQSAPLPDQDCNMFVRYGTPPTLAEHDYRDVGNASRYKISIANPRSGVYYAGVLGNKFCDFNITLHLINPECPNKCSGPSHGTCDEITYTCNCDPLFSGTMCNVMVPALVPNFVARGYVGDNAWNYYVFNTYTSANALVTLTQVTSHVNGTTTTFGDVDCDLYIARDRIPTFLDFDYRDITYRPTYSILVVGSGINTWRIGVHGYTNCNYNLTHTLVRTCLNSCTDSSHGTCMDGTCNCKPGWTGEDCSIAIKILENGQEDLGYVAVGEWRYYQFVVDPGTTASVYLREAHSTGFIWLFGNPSHLLQPTLLEHDVFDTEVSKSLHTMKFSASGGKITTYIIGVHGNAIAIPNTDYEYSIVAYQPRFE
jgi:hypothetical protein